ncbi:hypothetical protein [Pseudomonas putida]
MNTHTWLLAACLAASLPAQAASILKPIEVKDAELATLRGKYVMPGRIISFGVVMSTTWQNANGDVIGARGTLDVQATTIKPQFYVQMVDQKGLSGASLNQGSGSVTGGAGLTTTQGVTQSVRAAGDYNTAYNNVDINVKESGSAPAAATPQGQVLASGSTISAANAAGNLSVSSTGGGVQMAITANNNQGAALQSISGAGLLQNATLLGGANAVNNLTQLNVVLRDNLPTAGALDCNLSQLKGLRNMGM